MSEENKVVNTESIKKETPKGACHVCGFITPFNPDEEGFCCPVCGSPSGNTKK